MKKDLQTKRVALYGILGALSLVLSLFEHILIPDIPFLPAGAKPGLSNIAVMLTAYAVSSTGAVYIFLLKVLFAFITRGATAALMSFSGGLLSIIVLLLLVKNEGKSYSFITIGFLCAIAHNIGQLICCAFISGTAEVLHYAKYLFVFAIISGFLTGVILNLLKGRMSKSTLFEKT